MQLEQLRINSQRDVWRNLLYIIIIVHSIARQTEAAAAQNTSKKIINGKWSAQEVKKNRTKINH